MDEGDDVGRVGSGSESTVNVGVGTESTDDKSVVENLGCGSDDKVVEGSVEDEEDEDEDGGEIMVEVVGSDVFVDGVRGHGGGEDTNGEVGSEEPSKEGEERESDAIKGEGGGDGDLGKREGGDLGDHVSNGGSEIGDEGSLAETTGVVAVEDTEMTVNQEGLERDEGSGAVGGEVDSSVVLASQEANVLNDEAPNSGFETGIGDSSGSLESTHEETKVVIEEAMVTVCEEGLEKGLVDDSVDRGVADVMDDQVCTHEETKVVTEEAMVTVCEEGLEKGLVDDSVDRGVADVMDDQVCTHEETKVVTEEAMVTVCEEGLEKGLVDDSVDRGVADVMDDQVCTHEETKVVTEEAMVTVCEEGLEKGLVDDSVDRGVADVMDDQVCTHEETKVVTEEAMVTVCEEGLEKGLVEDSEGGGVADVMGDQVCTHEETKVVTGETTVTVCEEGLEKGLVEDSVDRGVGDVMDDQVCTHEETKVVTVETMVTVCEEGLEKGLVEDIVGRGVADVMDDQVCTHEETKVVTEETTVTVCEEGLEKGLVEDSVDTGVADVMDYQVCTHEETKVVTEETMVTVCEEGLERGLVEDSVYRGVADVMDDQVCTHEETKVVTEETMVADSVDRGVADVMDDQVCNTGIESTPICSSAALESLILETQVAAEEVAMPEINEEDSNRKDEIPGAEVVEVNLPLSETDQSSVLETGCSLTDKDGNGDTRKNDDLLDQQSKVTVEVEAVVMNTEESLDSQSEAVETDIPDGKLSCLVADQQTKADTVGESVENHCDFGVDSLSSSEPTKTVSGGDTVPMDDKFSSDSTVMTPGIIEELKSSEEEVEVVNNHEVTEMNSTISSSKVDSLTPDDMDVMVACTEDDQNVKGETTCGDGGKDDIVHTDLESSYEQECLVESAEFAPMDIEEVFSVKDEVPKIDELYSCYSGEDQNLKIETLEKVNGTSVDDVVAVMEGGKGLNSEVEGLDDHACSSEEDGKNPLAVVDVSEKDVVHGNTESFMDMQVESSVVDCQGKVEIPDTLDEIVSFSEQDEALKVRTDHESIVENNVIGKDSSVDVDSFAFGDHGVSVIGTISDSREENTLFRDEKQEPVVQQTETQTHEGIQNLDAELVSNDISSPDGDQTMSIYVSDVVISHEVVDQAIETKNVTWEENQTHEMSAHVTEAIDVKFDNDSTMGTLVVDIDNCLNKDQIQELQGEASGNFSWVAPNESQEVQVKEQNTDAVQVNLLGGQDIELREDPEGLNEEILEQTIPEPGSFERMHLASSFFPLENEDEFLVSDLVWGKVRSHPWWPGQIFDPMDASEKAMKYHKKDCFLVAYFGDRTFAWNEAHLLKPFWTHFSEVQKHSNSETFHNAVSCALEEVSRRVELGLACSCIPNDAFEKMEYQTVENTGIRQELSQRYGVDRSMGVSSFEPEKLLEYIRTLAQSPSGEGDRLELEIAKSQLLAISRLKGFYQLPEPQFCSGLLENDTDPSQLSEGTEHAGKSKTGKSTARKRKHNLRDTVYPWKKEKSLSDLGDMVYSPEGQDGSDGNAMSKSVSSSSGKKRKAVDDGGVQDRNISIYAAKVSTTTPPIPKPSFKIGECIRRVASQLTGPQSILKSSGEKLQKVGGRGEKDVGFDDSLHLDDILSQLHLAARDPLKGYSFLNTIITFFSGFRNSVIASHYSGRQTPSGGRGRKKKATHGIVGSAEDFEFDDVNDSYWTDMIIQNNGEEPLGNGNKDGLYQLVAFDPVKSPKLSRRSYSRKRFSNGGHELAAEELNGNIGERKNDLLPTELILNFTEGDSVPSEMNLNKIFRRFGSLKESETEVDRLTNRARVVFKKCSDAEVAFSSAAKFNIFGPMLVNYQLSYEPSLSFRTFPLETLQEVEDAI